MVSQRTLLGLVLGFAAAGSAAAQAPDALRFKASPGAIGLQARNADFRLNLQVGYVEPTVMDRVLGRADAPGLKFVGKTALLPEVGFYGKVGRTVTPAMRWADGNNAAASYGVGISWDFSPRASASLGWDAYDFRSVAGDRDVRATSLGLQWRY